jgi:hypothetical protein
VNLLCTLLISSTPSGASLDLFHSVARGEGGILSKDAAAPSSLPPSMLLSVSIVEASVLLSDKQKTDPSGLELLARFEKLECP